MIRIAASSQFFTGLVFVVALLSALLLQDLPAHAQKKVFYSGGIINAANGKGLDVRDQSRDDGANIQVWEFNNAPNQQWEILEIRDGVYSIVSKLSGKALDVQDKSVVDGANVQQYGFNNGANQLWRIQKAAGGVQIIGLASGKCLDVQIDKVKDNGANVQMWTCGGGRNQLWRLGR